MKKNNDCLVINTLTRMFENVVGYLGIHLDNHIKLKRKALDLRQLLKSKNLLLNTKL